MPMKFRLPIAAMSFVLLFGILAIAQESPQSGGAKSKRTSEEGGSSSSTGGGTSGSTTGSPSIGTKGELKPGSLEDLIDKALKNHPKLRLAAAKIRTAEALAQEAKDEYALEQHKIASSVMALYAETEAAKRTVDSVKTRLDIAKDAQRRGVGTTLEVVSEEANVARFAAEYESRAAQLKAFTLEYPQAKGQTGTSDGAATGSSPVFVDPVGLSRGTKEVLDVHRAWLGTAHKQADWAVIQNCQSCHFMSKDASASQFGFTVSKTAPTMNDRIRKALDKVVKFEGGGAVLSVRDIVEYFRDAAGLDVPIRVIIKTPKGEAEEGVVLMKGELPLGAWFQVIEDSLPEVRFVVREYGILVTNRDRVPEGAVYLQAFWKHKETAAPAKPDETKKSEPKKETPKK
jgi:hypothetical protein